MPRQELSVLFAAQFSNYLPRTYLSFDGKEWAHPASPEIPPEHPALEWVHYKCDETVEYDHVDDEIKRDEVKQHPECVDA